MFSLDLPSVSRLSGIVGGAVERRETGHRVADTTLRYFEQSGEDRT